MRVKHMKLNRLPILKEKLKSVFVKKKGNNILFILWGNDYYYKLFIPVGV